MHPILPPDPEHPIAAVTHADPYPYYARLARERPFAFEPKLNLWVAAGLEVVHACLTDPRWRVRPVAEPAPAAIADTPLGAVFAAWARMRDGQAHTGPRQMVEQVMADPLEDLAHTVAKSLCPASPSASALNALQFALPVQVVARHIGVAPEHLEQAQRLIERVVRALGPSASAAAVTDAGTTLEQALPGCRARGDRPATG